MVYKVKTPLLGFEHVKEMKFEQIDDLFVQLTGVDIDKPINFILVNPYMLRDYKVKLTQYIHDELEVEEDSQILIYNIMVSKMPIEESTVNFIAPILFNIQKKIMIQAILDSNEYPDYGLQEKISDYIEKAKQRAQEGNE
jgi:flagellar assembly factor FliW